MRGARRKGSSLQAFVRVRGKLYTATFPLGTAAVTIRHWREGVRFRAEQAHAIPGSLGAAVAAYLPTTVGMPSAKDRRHLIDAWLAAFGPDRPLASITVADIGAVLAAWARDGYVRAGRRIPYSASSLRLRVQALSMLYRVVAPNAPNPCRAVPLPRPAPPAPRALDPAVAQALLDSMRPSKTRARLRVMLTTGLPQQLLRQLRPCDLDLDARTVVARPRRKGAGAAGRVLPLSDAAVTAFREFVREDAFGAFDSASMRQVFRRAARKLGLSTTPYALRHTFGTLAYRTTRDLATTARLLCHASPAVTARYALAANDEVDRAAVEQIGKALQAPQNRAGCPQSPDPDRPGRVGCAPDNGAQTGAGLPRSLPASRAGA